MYRAFAITLLFLSSFVFADSHNKSLACDISKVQKKDWSEDMLGYQQTDYKKIFPIWLSKAKDGDPKYQFYIAKAYYFGNGVDKDLKKTLYWYKKSSNQGYPVAKNNLALMYKNGEEVEQDFIKYFQLICNSATQGLHISQDQIGGYYKDINQNDFFIKWYEKAAENGNIHALDTLALMYSTGGGVEIDYKKSLLFSKKSAIGGSSLGKLILADIYQFGRGVKVDYRISLELYLDAYNNTTQQSIRSAIAPTVADYYYLGRGTKVNLSEAFKWYLIAAEYGNIAAQRNIGAMLTKGEGVTQNDDMALIWIKKAAEGGDIASTRNLGIAYEKGKGIKKDISKAISLYTKAAELGSGSAMFNLAFLYQYEEGWKDASKAFEWYLKSSKAGFSPSYTRTGFNYMDGFGIQRNINEAIYWFYKSFKSGDKNAPIYVLLDLYLK